jgi:hypothetical protein
MDFLRQDEDDGDEDQNGDGGGEDDDDGENETASPTFQRSIANIRSKAFLTSFRFVLK